MITSVGVEMNAANAPVDVLAIALFNTLLCPRLFNIYIINKILFIIILCRFNSIYLLDSNRIDTLILSYYYMSVLMC